MKRRNENSYANQQKKWEKLRIQTNCETSSHEQDKSLLIRIYMH